MELNYYLLICGWKTALHLGIEEFAKENDFPYLTFKYETRTSDIEDTALSLVKQGYVPVVYGLNYSAVLSENASIICLVEAKWGDIYSNPFRFLLPMCGKEMTAWYNALYFNETRDYPFGNSYLPIAMEIMLKLGYEREMIDKVRTIHRQARGITAEEEMQAEKVLVNMEIMPNLLLVRGLPHDKFEAVIDRAFWHQPKPSLYVMSTLGKHIYIGYDDICLELSKHARAPEYERSPSMFKFSVGCDWEEGVSIAKRMAMEKANKGIRFGL